MPRDLREPNPEEQKLPEFAPTPTTGEEKWAVEHIKVGNEGIMAVDYLIRDGKVTSERRERFLTDQQVDALYRSRTKRTFMETCAHISELAP